MSRIRQLFILLNVCVLSLSIFSYAGCASSELTKFKKRTKTMSDAELLNCYYGINRRIKDIDNGLRMDDRLDYAQNHEILSDQPYFLGGEVHGLMQKEELVLKEMRKRNIKP